MSDSRLYESVIQPLTAENLQLLQEQFKNIKKTSTSARIIKWLSEIPQNLGSGDNVSTSNVAKEGGEFQTPDGNGTRNADTLGSQPQQKSNEKISKENSQNFNEYNNGNSMGKKNGSNNDIKKMMNNNTPMAANNASEKRSSRDKGRLCCYLKVEVGGNTQLLPIHENDIPQNLAYNFCKSNNILNSVNSLKEHIINAIENYMKKSYESLNNEKKKVKSKSKTKLNKNENNSKINKVSKSNENLIRNKSKVKSKSTTLTHNKSTTEKNLKSKNNSKSNENLRSKSNLKSNEHLKSKSSLKSSNEHLKSKSNLKSNENLKSKSNMKSNESLKKKVNTKYLKNSSHSLKINK